MKSGKTVETIKSNFGRYQDGDVRPIRLPFLPKAKIFPPASRQWNGGMLIFHGPWFYFPQGYRWRIDVADVRGSHHDLAGAKGDYAWQVHPKFWKYGFDNKNMGVLGYSGFKGEVSGSNHSFGTRSLIAFEPSWQKIWNTREIPRINIGMGFTEDFENFISTANGQHSVYFGHGE